MKSSMERRTNAFNVLRDRFETLSAVQTKMLSAHEEISSANTEECRSLTKKLDELQRQWGAAVTQFTDAQREFGKEISAFISGMPDVYRD